MNYSSCGKLIIYSFESMVVIKKLINLASRIPFLLSVILIITTEADAQSCLDTLVIKSNGFPAGLDIGFNEPSSVDVENGYYYRTDFYLIPYPQNNSETYRKINRSLTLSNFIKRMKKGKMEKRYRCELNYCQNLKTGQEIGQEENLSSVGRHGTRNVIDYIDGKKVEVFAGNTSRESLGYKEEIGCSDHRTVRYNRYTLRIVAISYNGQMQYLPYLGLTHEWVDYPSSRFTQKMPKFSID